MAAPVPYGRQSIDESDIQEVVNVLRSDWLTQGPAVERFEREVAAYCGTNHALAVANATVALHIACLAAGLGEGDLLWTSPNTFVASANCALYCGAEVDFVDIDPRTLNMSPVVLAEKLKKAKAAGRLPKVVVPVHFAGLSCDMEAISALAREYGFLVIEDASHAVGGNYRSQPIGSCAYGDMVVFSFHPVKIVTTGEGGMILTRNKDLHDKLLRLRSHGITRNPALMEGPPEGGWYYQQIELGFNYRITDMQAALGSSQWKKLDRFVERRHLLADRYDAELKDLPLVLPLRESNGLSALHLYPIRIDPRRTPVTRAEVYASLRAAGIEVNVHYIPVHTQPYYQKMGFRKGDFPEAEKYYAEALSLPMFPSLSEGDQNRVISALRGLLG